MTAPKILIEIEGEQADRAKLEAEKERILARFAQFNDMHCVVYDYYKKGVVYGTLVDGEWTFNAKTDLIARYEAERVKDPLADNKKKRIPIVVLWLMWPGRRVFERVTFMPNGPTVVGGKLLNLWRGWGVEPKEGSWDLMKKHLFEVVCKGREAHYEYLMNWMAWCVQNPDKQAEVAVVLIGLKGSGKTTVGEFLIKIFGHHTFQMNGGEDLAGKFNAHAENCVFLLADEASWRNVRHRDGIGRLNSMITAPTLVVERKGFDKFNAPNFLHTMLTAEPGFAFPAGPKERRYAPFGLSAERLRDFPYFTALRGEMDGDGPAAALWELMRRPLAGWHPREIPKEILESEEMVQQKLHSLDEMERWWLDCLTTGELPGQMPGIPNSMFSSQAVEDIKEKVPKLRFAMSTTGLQEWLEDEPARGWRPTKKRTAAQNGWLLPVLSECREAFEEKYGPQDWPAIEDWIAVSGAKREGDWWTAKVEKAIEERMPSVKKGVNFERQIVAVIDGDTVEYRVASDWLFVRINVPPEDRGPSHFERMRRVMEGLGWTHSESVSVGKRSMEGYTKREAKPPPSLHQLVAESAKVVPLAVVEGAKPVVKLVFPEPSAVPFKRRF
jgi:hypothetical protein